MNMMKKQRHGAGLWWASIITLTLGTVVYILLEPDYPDYNVERIRKAVLFVALIIPGFCVIIGTRRRWFGKDL